MRAILPFIRLFKHNKFQLFIGIVLMITGLAASIGLLTLSGWFLAATAIAGAGTLFNFFYPSAGVRGLAIGRTAARYVEKIVTHDATFRILAKLRVTIFSKIIPLSPAVLNRYRNSDLLNRLVADVDTLDGLYLRLIAPFISAIIVIMAITIGLSFINTNLALLIAVTLLTLLLLIPSIFYYLGKKFGDKLINQRASYRTQFVQYIQAQAELLLFNAKTASEQQLEQVEQQWQSYQAREANLTGFSTALLLFFNGLLVVAVLWFSATADLGQGIYKAAIIALVTFSALASFEILMPLGAAFLHIGQIIASAQRINEIITQQPLVQFEQNQSWQSQPALPIIQAKNLDFAYPHSPIKAIEQLNINIYAGEKIAILGKTGSGKSSLLQLLVRNYDSTNGELLLAGKPIATYNETTLREHICMLTQRIHIFSDTLRNNLQIGATEPISDEQMIQILSQVGLNHLLCSEQQLDLWLGDGGRPLSGGEQRRLGLARILLNNAPIILLDEPTEGLDRETERHIIELLLHHCQDKTLIMVTHRLTALQQFDQLYLIDNAKLIEQGTYNQLIAQKQSYFKQLVNRIN